MKNPTINIFVENIYEEFGFDEVEFHNDVQKMLKFAIELPEVKENCCLTGKDFSTLVFDIVLCNNEEIHRINREYRSIDRPTDVISFAMFADADPDDVFILDGEINLGEIIISLDKTAEQAKENGVSTDDEARLLAAHGILHLLGFDHQTDDDYNFVVKTQNKIKVSLNV